ncbi:MAG: DUF3977 family protein [Minisyncoccia bacterium]
MKKVFAEVGFGNDTFLSTEIEEGDKEYRIPKFVRPERITGVYLRFWICKTVFVISSDEGFKMTKRERNRVKFLFGVSGVE